MEKWKPHPTRENIFINQDDGIYILEYELAPRTPYVYFSTLLQLKKVASIDIQWMSKTEKLVRGLERDEVYF